jgi:hypothetical protein
LEREYIQNRRSMSDIASEFGVTDAAVRFWIRRHGIPTRSVAEARAIKHWGPSGEANPMFGRTGQGNPNWKGGHTPDRQGFYSSMEWAEASRAVWKRDKSTCQRCGSTPTERGTFHIHHIVPFAVKELRSELTNLVLLCSTCHRWVHSRSNTERLFIGANLERGGAKDGRRNPSGGRAHDAPDD